MISKKLETAVVVILGLILFIVAILGAHHILQVFASMLFSALYSGLEAGML